jgi:hypothetical protein
MGDRNKKSKTGKTCGRPFKAPRPAKQAETDIVRVIEERPRQSRNKVKGVRVVPETEAQERSSDSEDNVPVASLLRPKSSSALTLQQIEECNVGPVGEKAVGKTVAKLFDGVEFRGTVDRFRTERKRYVYHVIYTDGDEEELSQVELRDGYVLGLSAEITAQWQTYKLGKKDTSGEEVTQDSEDEGSDVEGSTYDTSSEDEVFLNKKKRIRKENATKSKTKKKSKNWPDLSRVVMPKSGDKTVAAEAFQKLSAQQKTNVAEKVNKKTKKVLTMKFIYINYT